MKRVDSIDKEIDRWKEAIDEANGHIEKLMQRKQEIQERANNLDSYRYKCYEISDKEYACVVNPIDLFEGNENSRYTTLLAEAVVVTIYPDGSHTIVEDPDYAISLVYMDMDTKEYVPVPEIDIATFRRMYKYARDNFDRMLNFCDM